MSWSMHHAQRMFARHKLISIFEKLVNMIGFHRLLKKACAPRFWVVVVDELSLPTMGGDVDLKVGLEVSVPANMVAVVVRIDEQPEPYRSNGAPL